MRVVHTTTIAAKGWDNDDIVDITADLSVVFGPDEEVVVISAADYTLLLSSSDEVSRLQARVKELEDALRPFADQVEHCGNVPDWHTLKGQQASRHLTVGHLRKARVALEGKGMTNADA